MRRAAVAAWLALAGCGGDAGNRPDLCPEGHACRGGGVVGGVAGSQATAARISAVAADAFGDVAIAGDFVGTLALEGALMTGGDDQSAFVARWRLGGEAHGAVPIGVDTLGGLRLGGLAPHPDGDLGTLVAPHPIDLVGPVDAITAAYASFASRPLGGALQQVFDLDLAADRHGRMIVAVASADNPGPNNPLLVVSRIARIDQAGPTWLAGWDDVVIHDVAVGPGDDVFVAGRYGAMTPDFPPCALSCGFIARLNAGGGLGPPRGWLRVLASASPTEVHRLAVGADRLVALASAGGPVDAPPVPASTPALLLEIAPDTGEIARAVALADQQTPTTIGSHELAMGNDGTAYVALTFAGRVDLGGGGFVSAGGDYNVAVAAHGRDGAWRWSKLLGEGTTMQVFDLALVQGYLVLAGQYRGAFPVTPIGQTPPPPSEVDTACLVVIDP